MFFEIIITLTVSLGAILAFRQVDKKDRSLEKIRDFTNKVRSDLDVYFQENANKAKNSVNDLETAQTTAVAAVKRLEEITRQIEEKEAEYKARAANLDEINSQIDRFNTMLTDLVEMSGNAEENLLRIQTESRFLDKTAKKIQTQKDMLDSIEARIPTLLADFEKTDSEKLDACTASLKSHIQEQAQYLAETAEQAVRQNESLLSEVRKTCENALAVASDKAGSMEDDAFQKMAAASQERLGRHSEEIAAAIDAFLADARQKLETSRTDAASDLDAARKDAEGRISAIRDESASQIASLKADLTSQYGSIRDDAQAMLASLKNETEVRISEVQEATAGKISQIQEDSGNRIAEISAETASQIAAIRENAASEINAIRQETASGITAARAEAEAEIAAIREKTDSEIETVTKAVDETITSRREELTANLNERLASGIAHVESDTTARLALIQGTVTDRIKSLETETVNLTGILADQFHKKADELGAELTASFTAQNAELLKTLSAQTNTLSEELEATKTRLETTINEFQNQLAVDFENKRAELEKQLSDHETAFNEKLTAAESSVAAFKQSFDSESSSVLDYARNELKRMSEEQKADVASLEKERADFDAEFTALKDAFGQTAASLTEQVASVNTSLSEQIAQFRGNLEKALSSESTGYSEKQQKYFAEMEKQLEQCKSDVLYRFERLNTSTEEINGLEQALRDAMAAARQRVDSDFARFSQSQLDRQATFESDLAGRSDALTTRLHDLEGEINDLKEKAYGSVSEKLKVFEDDFFNDLSKRSSTMEESLVQWQRDVNGKMNELSNQYEDARRLTEEKYNNQMKNELSSVQDRLKEQIARLEGLIQSSEQTLQDRINNTEYGFRAYIEQQRVELENARNSASEYMKNELTSYNTQADEILKRYERDINTQLEQIAQNVGASQEKTESQVQAVLSDFSSWSDRMNVQFEETKNMFSEKLNSLDQNASDLISQVQQSFTTDLADFNRKIAEDRNSMSIKLDDVKKDMQTTLSEYDAKSRSVIDELQRNYDEMQTQVQHAISETNADSEQKLRVLKDMVQDIRTRTDAAQDKLLGKIQADANALNLSLDAVDKRLKEYMAQTQIIDKVEEHKVKLEDQLTSLRAEITKFDNFKQTAADVDQQINKIRKAEEEISMNAQKFLAEKKRMDLMEADFNKLMMLSSTMDQKITELQNSHDDLQLIQADIRKFQDAITDISGQYDRLDKKTPVLEQTIADVDRSFDTLKTLEKRLAECDAESLQIPSRLEGLQTSVAKLLDASPKISDAVTKLASLDSIIKSTEARMGELTKSNEWLARTEGRLQEIAKGADSQLQLLKTITSKNDGSAASVKGAPPIAVRENVISLSHKGWSVAQISNALKLTQAEVELILDYYGNDAK